MAFTGIDSVFANISSGRYLFNNVNKINNTGTALTANRWADTFTLTGNPSSGSFPGLLLSHNEMNYQTYGSIYHGGNKLPYKKYLLNMEALTSVATGGGSYLMLVDMLLYYVVDTASTNAQNLDTASGENHLPLRDGVQHTGDNVYMFIEPTNTTAAATPNISLTYTDSSGTGNKVLGATPTGVTGSTIPHIFHSGVAAGNYGPFLPYPNGVNGVQSVQSIQFGSAGTAGVYAALVLCEPLATIQIGNTLSATSKDFLFSKPTLPRIRDGACLNFLMYNYGAVAAATNFFITLDFVWG